MNKRRNDMAEYIDREKLLEQITEPMNWTDSEAELQEQADYQAFKNMVENAPTEDVVPRSEIVKIFKAFETRLLSYSTPTFNDKNKPIIQLNTDIYDSLAELKKKYIGEVTENE
jgi:hypothetical protein